MKRISFIFNISVLLSIFVFTSCEKEITLDLKSADPHLMIEGVIPVDSLACVRLTMTKDFYGDNNYPPVEGAKVTISDSEGNTEDLELMVSGWYEAKAIKGVEGRSYHLTVNVDGDIYTATSTMPYAVPIDSITMYYVPVFEEGFPMVHFNDPEGIENFYRFKLWINGRKMPGIDVSSDEDRDGKKFGRLLPVDSEYNNDEDIKKGDEITVETQFIDKGAYTFFDTLSNIIMNQTNPTSNIVGGALGYFSAYSYDYRTIIADWEE